MCQKRNRPRKRREKKFPYWTEWKSFSNFIKITHFKNLIQKNGKKT